MVTQRQDGTFLVDIIDRLTREFLEENNQKPMDICKNCLTELDEKYNDDLFVFRNFQLSVFLEKYNTSHTQMPKYNEKTLPKNDYPDNWQEISLKKRKSVNWKCEACGNDCSKNKKGLDVHHVSGKKYDNSPKNLKALCRECHAKQPGHESLNFLPK